MYDPLSTFTSSPANPPWPIGVGGDLTEFPGGCGVFVNAYWNVPDNKANNASTTGSRAPFIILSTVCMADTA